MQNIIPCRKHTTNYITFICTKQNCSQGNLLCQQCINGNPNHRNEHKNYLCTIQDFLYQQNGKTRKILIPQIKENIQELDKKLKEYNQLIDKETLEIDSDISQFFKIFHDLGEKSKKQIQETLRKDLIEQQAKNLQYQKQLQDILAIDQRRNENQNYLFTMFHGDQDKELPISEQSLIQIINRNANINQLKNDILVCQNQVCYALQPNSQRIRYKSTSYQQSQFNQLKMDFIQSMNCLFQKMNDLTQDFNTVEDMKRSLYQFGSTDGSQSLKQSQVIQRTLGQSQFISSGHQSQRFHRSNSQSQIMSVKYLEIFPSFHPIIQQVLNKLGHLQVPQQDSLLNNIESVSPCQFPDGIIYVGQIQNNQRFGWGSAIIGQDYYEGYWRAGQPFGFGRIIMINGDYYEGFSQNCKANGKGIYCSNGYVYDGDWLDDQKHGKGTEISDGKYQYEGEFQNNLKNGQGILTDFITGNKFNGDFINDQLNGQCTIEYSNGDRYLGQIITVDGIVKRHGQGIYQWNDSRKYEGMYENDFEHGEGTFWWPDQVIYKGTWYHGVQHGKGLQFNQQGKEREGIWQNGQFQQWIS